MGKPAKNRLIFLNFQNLIGRFDYSFSNGLSKALSKGGPDYTHLEAQSDNKVLVLILGSILGKKSILQNLLQREKNR